MTDPRHRHALSTLRHRDFRLLWIGQLISVVGDQIQVVAIAWHIYILTNSPLQLGLVGVARAVPFMLLTLLGGAAADTIDRKRLLLITQTFQIFVSVWLIVATISGRVSPWTLYAVTFLTAAAQAFDIPARTSLVPNVVPPEELSNAFTLNTLLRQSAFIVGPGIGGILIATVGLSWTYLANGVSFIALMAAVLLMGPVGRVAMRVGSNWDKVAGGLRYALAQPLVLLPISIDFVTRCLGNARGLLPIFARDVFAVGPQGLGWLNAAISAGAVAGGLALGARGPLRRPLALMILAYAAEAACLIGLGISPTFLVALAVLFAMGIFNVLAEVPRMTTVQMMTPDELRGRVTALSSMFTYGGPQLGQVDSGAVAAAIGPSGAAIVGGAAAVAATVGFGLLPSLRKGYREVKATSSPPDSPRG